MSYQKAIQVRKDILRDYVIRARTDPSIDADSYFNNVRVISAQITLFEQAEAERIARSKRKPKVK